MQYRFFDNVQTIEDLKAQYKKLAFKHHPDVGGRLEDMQAINAEYDELLKHVRYTHKTAEGKTYTKKPTGAEVPDRFKDIIQKIINFNCRIELCGAWLWVFNAYNYRKQLKDLEFFYCSGKKAWAWTDQPTNNKHRLTLDEIRRLHGSEVIKEEQEQEENKKLGVAV